MDSATHDSNHEHAVHPSLPFYSVSLTKIVVLSLATVGVYTVYWFYKHWKRVRDRTGSPQIPLAWAILSWVVSYALFSRIKDELEERSLRAGYYPGVLAVAFFLLTYIPSRLPHAYVFIAVLAFLPLLPAQRAINRLHASIDPQFDRNRHFGWRHFLLLGLAFVIWPFAVLVAMGPDEKALKGSEIAESDLEVLRAEGYLLNGEELLFYYSSGLFSIREGGCLITDRGIVKYETRDEVKLHESAVFEEIVSIDVNYSDSWLVDTSIRIVTRDGRTIELAVSPKRRRDIALAERLMTEWKKNSETGEQSAAPRAAPGE